MLAPLAMGTGGTALIVTERARRGRAAAGAGGGAAGGAVS